MLFLDNWWRVIKPEFVVIAIYWVFGLNLVDQDQSVRVVMSVKKPRSLEYNETFLSVPVMTKYSPEWWKFIEMGLQEMCLSLNFYFFSPLLSK
jgi:hypothetical protein